MHCRDAQDKQRGPARPRASGTAMLAPRSSAKNACPKRAAAGALPGPGGRAASQCTTCAAPASRRRAAARADSGCVACVLDTHGWPPMRTCRAWQLRRSYT